MFSAVFMITFAEGADETAKQEFSTALQEAAAAVSPVNLATKTLEPPMPGGDFFCELGFENQQAYEAVKGEASWTALQTLLAGEVVGHAEFAAYGEGTLVLQEKDVSLCHRVLIFSLIDNPDPAMVAHMESHMTGMTKHVPGLRNCKFAKVVEASGTNKWNYAFECDFDEPGSFLGKYMTTPYHFCYIDKFFEPACNEWIVDTNLCTPYVAQETPFLANFAE